MSAVAELEDSSQVEMDSVVKSLVGDAPLGTGLKRKPAFDTDDLT